MMHAIRRLNAENAALREALATAMDGMDALSIYVQSSKFWTDPNVNVADVSLRLTQAKCRVSDVLINAGLSIGADDERGAA